MSDIVSAVVDENFDVHQRLARMRGWQNEYFSEDEQLQVRFRQLDANKPLDVQRGHQIGQLRKILILKQLREPLEVVMGSDQPRSRQRFAKIWCASSPPYPKWIACAGWTISCSS